MMLPYHNTRCHSITAKEHMHRMGLFKETNFKIETMEFPTTTTTTTTSWSDKAIYNALNKCQLTGILIRIIDFCAARIKLNTFRWILFFPHPCDVPPHDSWCFNSLLTNDVMWICVCKFKCCKTKEKKIYGKCRHSFCSRIISEGNPKWHWQRSIHRTVNARKLILNFKLLCKKVFTCQKNRLTFAPCESIIKLFHSLKFFSFFCAVKFHMFLFRCYETIFGGHTI